MGKLLKHTTKHYKTTNPATLTENLSSPAAV